jgi:blue copper oxidase
VSSHARTSRVGRRTFLRAAMASLGVAAVGGAGLAVPRTGLAAKGGGGKGTVTGNPLNIPPTVSPGTHTLSAAPGQVDLGGGKLSWALAYDGVLPGPTFRTISGSGADVQLVNGLAHETTIHWHGMIVPPAADGHPSDRVLPGETYRYQFTVVQRACTNWYHPHPHMRTGEQVALGLAGAFIVNDAEEASLGLPSGGYEIPLIVRDASLDRQGNLVYTTKSSGFMGKIPLVNGTRDASLDVDTAIYRFRVLNGANARLFRLALSNPALPFMLIGNDGGLLDAAVQAGELEIGPGERLDLLVDFRALAPGNRVMLVDRNSGWNLLELVVTRAVSGGGSLPAGPLSAIERLSNPVTVRQFSFDGMSRINGRVYDLDRLDFEVPFGQTELWRFRTAGNAPHPVHVHGASFQVVSRTGGRNALFPWEGGWKDTVLLQDKETVEVLVRFDAYRGRYLLHCHQLEHEDSGMMANFEVI